MYTCCLFVCLFVCLFDERILRNAGLLLLLLLGRYTTTLPPIGLVDSIICSRRRDPKEFSLLLLLHEATLEDAEKELAVKKKHSTVSEAMHAGGG